MSKEHIWPTRWHDLLPTPIETPKRIGGSLYSYDENKSIWTSSPKKEDNRQGRTLDVTSRSLCTNCNGGWVNEMQNRATSTITPFFKGYKREVDIIQQNYLAAWACHFTIVVNSRSESEMVTSQAARDYIWRHKSPPANWVVLVGTFDNSATWRNAYKQAAFTISFSSSQDASVLLSMFTAGKSVYFVIACPESNLINLKGSEQALAAHSKMDVLFPLQFNQRWIGQHIHTSRSCDEVFDIVMNDLRAKVEAKKLQTVNGWPTSFAYRGQ